MINDIFKYIACIFFSQFGLAKSLLYILLIEQLRSKKACSCDFVYSVSYYLTIVGFAHLPFIQFLNL